MTTQFHTSTLCSCGGCVELAHRADGGVILRSTRTPDHMLELDATEWADFVAGIRAGDFDRP